MKELVIVPNKRGGRYPKIPESVRDAVMAEYAAKIPLDILAKKYKMHKCTILAIRRETGTPAQYPHFAKPHSRRRIRRYE